MDKYREESLEKKKKWWKGKGDQEDVHLEPTACSMTAHWHKKPAVEANWPVLWCPLCDVAAVQSPAILQRPAASSQAGQHQSVSLQHHLLPQSTSPQVGSHLCQREKGKICYFVLWNGWHLFCLDRGENFICIHPAQKQKQIHFFVLFFWYKALGGRNFDRSMKTWILLHEASTGWNLESL